VFPAERPPYPPLAAAKRTTTVWFWFIIYLGFLACYIGGLGSVHQ